MNRLRTLSIISLSIASFVGTVRGYRMIGFTTQPDVLFPYREEAIRMSVFSNYNLFGWIIFVLLGLFSFVTLICIVKKTYSYSYFMITEGIFQCFFTLTHILYNGFLPVHIFMLPVAISTIALGIMQTPREFS